MAASGAPFSLPGVCRVLELATPCLTGKEGLSGDCRLGGMVSRVRRRPGANLLEPTRSFLEPQDRQKMGPPLHLCVFLLKFLVFTNTKSHGGIAWHRYSLSVCALSHPAFLQPRESHNRATFDPPPKGCWRD